MSQFTFLSTLAAALGAWSHAAMRAVEDRLARVVLRRTGEDAGQATVEYALVILAAAAIALLVVAWAARSGKIGELMDRVFDAVTGRVA